MKQWSKKQGFTLVELLVVVLIIGILTTIALPNYNRSIEKSRATEALTNVKAVNDAIYTYSAERGVCPSTFKKLLISIPGEGQETTLVTTKYFTYGIGDNGATAYPIPGSGCPGVLATRRKTSVAYQIWNPYQVTNDAYKKRTLVCTSANDDGKGICKSLGLFPDDAHSSITPTAS